MKKQVIVCDFCQSVGTDKVAMKCCCICGQDYCEEHTRYVGVLVEGRTRLAVRGGFEVCPSCHGLLAFDNWTTGQESTRAPEFDRPIIKAVLPRAIEAVKQSLKEIHRCVGPGSVREWVSKQGGEGVEV